VVVDTAEVVAVDVDVAPDTVVATVVDKPCSFHLLVVVVVEVVAAVAADTLDMAVGDTILNVVDLGSLRHPVQRSPTWPCCFAFRRLRPIKTSSGRSPVLSTLSNVLH
jgi:hypothetical protein